MRRKILDLTQSYISLGMKFYVVYAITNSAIEKTKNMVCCCSSSGMQQDHISTETKYG